MKIVKAITSVLSVLMNLTGKISGSDMCKMYILMEATPVKYVEKNTVGKNTYKDIWMKYILLSLLRRQIDVSCVQKHMHVKII